MAENKEENDAYIREVNDYFVSDKKIGDEVEFVFGKEIMKIILTEEFEDAVNKLENTNRSAFITGKAGTGKSTLLKYFRSKSKKEIAVLAYTGLAAVNVGGETIHSFFNFPVGFLDKRSVQSDKKTQMILRTVKTIVVDEVSMVRADLMDAINVSLQKNRMNGQPFGGVQMIFIGDLHQLPPIIEKEMRDVYSRYYKTPFFFSADVFNEHKIIKIDLQKIHRQTEPLFVEILNNIRERKHVWASAKMLNRNVVDKNFLVGLQTSSYVVLCTTNDKSKKINDYYMNKIDSPVKGYKAQISGEFDEVSYPTTNYLELKEGSKVIFIKNDTHKKQYVNGDVGVVRQMTNYSILVEMKTSMISVERARWDKYKYDVQNIKVTDENGIVEVKRVVVKTLVGAFEQFPLKLAWAISIHKSQGQTYDNVLIDFDRGCFSSGQAYVALSRCRSYNGIKLRRPMIESDVILDNRIYEIDKIIDREEKVEI